MAALMRFRWPRGLRVVLAAAALAAAGCDLFKPAEPEPPVGEVLEGDYTEPAKTLETLAEAMEAKGTLDGQNVYLKGFADPALDGRSFVAEFDPLTLSRYQGLVPSPWSRDEEASFYGNVSEIDNDPREMRWTESELLGDPAELPTDTSEVLHRKYELFRVSSTNALSHIAYGHAELRFIRTSRGWVISRWEDHEDPNPPAAVPSYGMLRLTHQ